MRRLFLLALAVLGTCAAAFGQGASSDPQTLQAILTEGRALRQDLRVSQARTQSMQILLVRFQMQERIVEQASERLAEARSKASEAQIHQKEIAEAVKRMEDALAGEVDPQRRKALQERLNQAKSDLEVAGEMRRQRQAAEIQEEQQLRAEQDKLSALETQLDDLIRTMGSAAEPSGGKQP